MSQSYRVLIEVAVETPDDAAAARAGGADRLELCAALDLGGLTPTPGLVREVLAAAGPVPVVVMLRPRPGDFVATADELRVMRHDLDALLTLKPAGVVFGALNADGTLNRDACSEIVRAAGRVPCVLHRAFDRCPDPPAALDAAVELGFARILTSGGAANATEGSLTIAKLVGHAAGRIAVMPCGRVRAKSVAEVVRVTGCRQVHGSFAEPVPPGSGLGYRGYVQRSRTRADEVAETRAALDSLALGLLD